MPAIRKIKRNKNLVEDRDVHGMLFLEIGKKYGIKKHTAWEVYQREKARADEKQSKVSEDA